MAQSPITFLRLPEATRKEAERVAIREDRSLASMLRLLIKEALAARKNR